MLSLYPWVQKDYDLPGSSYSVGNKTGYPDSGDGTGVTSGWVYPVYFSYAAGSEGTFIESTGVFNTESSLGAFLETQAIFNTQSSLGAYATSTGVFNTQSSLGAFLAAQAVFNAQSTINVYVSSTGIFNTQSTLNSYVATQAIFNTQSALYSYAESKSIFTTQSALAAFISSTGTFTTQSTLNSFEAKSAAFNSQSVLNAYLASFATVNTQSALFAYDIKIGAFTTQSALYAYTETQSVFNTQSLLNAYVGSSAVFNTQSWLHAVQAYYGWAINLETGAVSKYENYPFNSMSGTIGASSSGIHGLYGTTDNGSAISSFVETGSIKLSQGSNLTRAVDAYIGVDGGILTMTVTDEKTGANSYSFPATTQLKTVKSNLGRGCKGKYWKVRLENVAGSVAAVESIELNVETLSRRI